MRASGRGLYRPCTSRTARLCKVGTIGPRVETPSPMISRFRIAALSAVVSSFSWPAQADETSACFDAHVRAQVDERDGKLGSARAELALCARRVCPAKVQKDCAEWLSEIDKLVPSVIVKARDARGNETADVEVFIDGNSVSKALDGRP